MSIYESESEDTLCSLESDEETMDATELHLDDLLMEEPDEALNVVDQNDDSSGECIYFSYIKYVIFLLVAIENGRVICRIS